MILLSGISLCYIFILYYCSIFGHQDNFISSIEYSDTFVSGLVFTSDVSGFSVFSCHDLITIIMLWKILYDFKCLKFARHWFHDSRLIYSRSTPHMRSGHTAYWRGFWGGMRHIFMGFILAKHNLNLIVSDFLSDDSSIFKSGPLEFSISITLRRFLLLHYTLFNTFTAFLWVICIITCWLYLEGISRAFGYYTDDSSNAGF